MRKNETEKKSYSKRREDRTKAPTDTVAFCFPLRGRHSPLSTQESTSSSEKEQEYERESPVLVEGWRREVPRK